MMGILLPIAVLAAPVATADAAQRASVRAFIATLYAGYRPNGPGIRNKMALYAPALARLVSLDAEQAHGEAGLLDYDPFCQCQDWDRITVRWLSLETVPSGAIARLELTYGADTSPQKPQRISLTLERASRGWLVSDIGSAAIPSLRAMLTHELQPKPRSKR